MNSYETEEIAEITVKWSTFHLCQVHRELCFAVYVRYKDIWISILSTGQTTDNRQQTTDEQTQILNPALRMRARVKKMERVHKEFSVISMLAWLWMFAGLLKHLNSRLEGERHSRVPWPRYSRKM